MAEITASMVKELREKTGAGMMDCKKALAEAGGNMEQAIDELRKRGQAIAQKKGARATKEGLIFAKVDGQVAAMIEINCESDFVARNEDFLALGETFVSFVLAGGPAVDSGSVDQILAGVCPATGKTLAEILTAAIAKSGENTSLRRFVRIDATGGDQGGFVTCYIHPPGKLGVLVQLLCGKAASAQSEDVAQLGRDLAMQVAAASPVSLNRDGVPGDVIERERAIFRGQAEESGKPQQIWDKIIDGKMSKFYKDSCLLEQIFVKDQDLTIQGLIDKVAKGLGDTIQVVRYERFVVGGDQEQEQEEQQ